MSVEYVILYYNDRKTAVIYLIGVKMPKSRTGRKGGTRNTHPRNTHPHNTRPGDRNWDVDRRQAEEELVFIGTALLKNAGVVLPDTRPVLGVHQNLDEVFLHFRGAEALDFVTRCLNVEIEGSHYIVLYLPSAAGLIGENGPMFVIRKFSSEPSDEQLAHLFFNEWNSISILS